MNENISAEQYRDEIYALNKKLDLAEQQLMDTAYTDPKNPFDNPTEIRHYNSDYRKIEPEIKKPFYKLPLEPEYSEKRNIKRFYNITLMQIAFRLISSHLLMFILTGIITSVLSFINPQAGSKFISDYFYSTISSPANMLVFLICNVAFAFLGLKMTDIPPSSLVNTCDFTLLKAVAYLFIAFFINHFSTVIISFTESVMNQCGLNMYNINDYTNFQSTPSRISDFVYAIIVAPITEELFYRGMVLKNFSRASQRCGIFISAMLFAFMHTTVPQIILGFIMGIFLAHITIKHNSIIPAIMVHSFNNSLGYIMSPLGNITSDIGIVTANSFYYMAVMLGLFALIAFKLTNKLPHDTPQQSRRSIALAFQSVPLIILVIYYIFMTLSYILQVS